MVFAIKSIIELSTHIILPLAISVTGAYIFKRLEAQPTSLPVPTYKSTEDKIEEVRRLEESYKDLSSRYENLEKDYNSLLEIIENSKGNSNTTEYLEYYRNKAAFCIENYQASTLKGFETGSQFQFNLNAPFGPIPKVTEESFDTTLIDTFYVKLISTLSGFDLSGFTYF